MAEQLLITEALDDATLCLTLNRPAARNALNIELTGALTAALAGAASDMRRRIIILRGAGPVFCAGLDLKEAADADKAHQSAEGYMRLCQGIVNSPLIVITRAHGAAMGGGAGLVAAADFSVGTPDLKIGFPEVRRGLVPAIITPLLFRRMPAQAVRRVVLQGEGLSADEARQYELLDAVAEEEGMLGVAQAFAEKILAGGPDAVVRTKRHLAAQQQPSIEAALQQARAMHLEAREGSDLAEGVAAFREKRAPKWGGRTL